MDVVERIIQDLRDRKGLRQAWDEIDEDIQQEIRDEWARLLRESGDGGE